MNCLENQLVTVKMGVKALRFDEHKDKIYKWNQMLKTRAVKDT